MQIRESIVTPYCQDLFLHWMMAEKDDWIPTTDIPVSFSAVQGSEPKPNSEAQPKPGEENDKSDQSKAQIQQSTDSPAQSIGHGSPAQSIGYGSPAPSPVQSTRSSSQGPPAAAAAPPPSQPQSGGPQVSRNQSRFAPTFEQEHSVPSRASAPPSLREGNESDLTMPLLEDENYSRDSSIDLDSDRATARPIDLSQLSDGSASLSESELPSHQVRIASSLNQHIKIGSVVHPLPLKLFHTLKLVRWSEIHSRKHQQADKLRVCTYGEIISSTSGALRGSIVQSMLSQISYFSCSISVNFKQLLDRLSHESLNLERDD